MAPRTLHAVGKAPTASCCLEVGEQESEGLRGGRGHQVPIKMLVGQEAAHMCGRVNCEEVDPEVVVPNGAIVVLAFVRLARETVGGIDRRSTDFDAVR
jgi:hypothetical protein